MKDIRVKMKNLPNFMFIGHPSSGTTSIYEYLKHHPEIFAPEEKEPFFFSVYDLPKERGEREIYPFPKERVAWTLEDYQQRYEGAEAYKAIGDFSPAYILSPEIVINNLKKVYGDAYKDIKIIITLRNPIQTAFSNYFMFWSRNQAKKPLVELFDEYKKNKEEGYTLNSGIYKFLNYERVKTYQETFNDVKVAIFDDMKTDLESYLKEFLVFLDVDSTFEFPNIKERYNTASQRTRDPFTNTSKGYMAVKNSFQKMMPEKAYDSLRMKIVKLSNKTNKPVLDDKTKQVLKDFYEEDIKKTSELIGRDLTSWMEI